MLQKIGDKYCIEMVAWQVEGQNVPDNCFYIGIGELVTDPIWSTAQRSWAGTALMN